ncbi:Uncharacterised protein [Burkholderia pseudomallei]|nr:Uncharacterised protein [Burkholderia pseudomallei]CAJ2813717.1 Uncharacterised protein [Burkholderia pseudomallei]CAJ2819833.1 Uncharacterised protein [Burkholderia pseudomallei]CAJ2830056.1 Uncharacterised protein [Burkholderia pseudomallei]CAJ2899986.1 Uncharacterised protein [Burkholderia pseudomallei]
MIPAERIRHNHRHRPHRAAYTKRSEIRFQCQSNQTIELRQEYNFGATAENFSTVASDLESQVMFKVATKFNECLRVNWG